MKPLRLKLAGLNSFREPQEIDFAALCQGGLFGIFGPTGSGKSTILDAITLALFGSVERAANNTQGILNLAQDNLYVQFTFSLGTGAQCKVYRSERAYRRAAGNSVQAGACRLVELKDGKETVLAGSTREVNEKVKAILGLNLDDFTRAVVLPQGKFAEFMSLAPGDRRNMLERLFGLEEYGKNLATKLKQQLEQANFHLNGIKERQLGMGDASADRMQEAIEDVGRTTTEVAAIDKNLSLLKHKYEEVKEIWGLQEDLFVFVRRESALAQRRQEITTLAERLDQAQRAETLRPLLLEEEQVEEARQKSQIQVGEAGHRLVEARTAFELTERRYADAQAQRTAHEPGLVRRIEQLEQGIALEEEIRVKTDKRNELRRAYRVKLQEKEGLIKDMARFEHQKQELRQTVAGGKTRLREIAISPEQRTQVEAAARALEAYTKVCQQITGAATELAQGEQQVTELTSRLVSKQLAVAQAEARLKALKEESQSLRQRPPAAEELLLTDTQELERCRGVFQNIQRVEEELAITRQEQADVNNRYAQALVKVASLTARRDSNAQSLADAKARYDQSKQALQELETKNMAGLLVEHLVNGEPCPVCGSAHHPAPALMADQDALQEAREAAVNAEQSLKDLETRHGQIGTELAVAQSQVDNLHENLSKQILLGQEKERAATDLRGSLPPNLQALPVADIKVVLEQWAANVETAKNKLAQWKRDLDRLDKESEVAQSCLTGVAAQEADLRAATEAAKSVVNRQRSVLDQLNEDKQAIRVRLDEARGEIESQDIPVLSARFAAWDREAAVINKRMVETEQSLQAAENALEKAGQAINQVELAIKELETAVREAGMVLQEMEAKLAAITGGGKPDELMAAAQQELAHIRENEEISKVQFEQAKSVFTTAEQNLAVARKELDMYAQRRQRMQVQLELGLHEAGFLTASMAKSALCDAGKRNRMAEDIDNYQKEQAVLREQREQTNLKLRGRQVEAAEWLAWPIRIKEVEDAFKQALARHESAKITLAELQKRQAEWQRLEEEKQTVAHRLDLLTNLQKALQGNAFVEYVAQEQLTNVAIDASDRLGKLTNQKYALELDSGGGFVIRDDGNGGARRPVYSFSGGEKFMASLSLALALSTQIQLRGEAPLEFFFLDEGFGTLDKDSLEAVMNTLEKLRLQDLAIGIISHVEELKSRLARRLVVTPAQPGGEGSRVKLETA